MEITQKQLEHRLEVTPMTLYLWRKGEGFSYPLPCNVDPSGKKNRVAYDEDSVLKWLEVHRSNLVQKFKEDGCECSSCTKRRITHTGAEGNSTIPQILQQQSS